MKSYIKIKSSGLNFYWWAMDSEGCSNIALQIKSSDKIRFLSVITCFVGRKKKLLVNLFYLLFVKFIIYLLITMWYTLQSTKLHPCEDLVQLKSSGLILIDEQLNSEGCAWDYKVVIFFLFASNATVFVKLWDKFLLCKNNCIGREPFDGLAWTPLYGLFWIHSNRKTNIELGAEIIFILFYFFVCYLLCMLHMQNYPPFIKELNETKVSCSVLNDCLPVY